MTEPLVLYVEASWSSPWVCAVFATLREKALPFSTAIAMIRRGAGAIDPLKERTLTGTAPVLQHGAHWIAESLAIVEYLDELFPTPRMLPTAPHDRARARQLMAWMRSDHESLRRERPTEWIVYAPRSEPPSLSPAASAVVEDLVRVATRLGADGRGHIFDAFGIVDIEFAFALQRLIATNVELPAPLVDYAAAVWARPSIREFIEHPRPPNPPNR